MATTWDGKAISPEPPFGATVVVYRRTGEDVEYLLLHRAHHGPAFEGEWAWTPPAGARQPGEPVDMCATRELYEEAGLNAPIQKTNAGTDDWCVFKAEVDHDANVELTTSSTIALSGCRSTSR